MTASPFVLCQARNKRERQVRRRPRLPTWGLAFPESRAGGAGGVVSGMLFLACPPFSLIPVSGCVRESPRGLVVRFQDPGSVCRPERQGPSSTSAPGPHGMKSAAWLQQNSGAVPPTATDHGVTTDESHFFFLIRNSATLSDPFASHSFHPRRSVSRVGVGQATVPGRPGECTSRRFAAAFRRRGSSPPAVGVTSGTSSRAL